MNGLKVGNKISWVSGLGYTEGVITKISYARSAAGNIVPWMTIGYESDGEARTVRLCGSANYLEMMQVCRVQ